MFFTYQSGDIWKRFALEWERLIINNVPMKDIHLILSHCLLKISDILLNRSNGAQHIVTAMPHFTMGAEYVLQCNPSVGAHDEKQKLAHQVLDDGTFAEKVSCSV